MDDKGYDDYRVELGAKISADTNSKVNKFIKMINKIPEDRELRLRINKKNTLSKALNKELKAWNRFEKKATSGLNLFKGRRQLEDVKGFYSKMRRTALSEMKKLYAELSNLTDKNSEDPRSLQNISKALEEQRNQLEQNKVKQEEYQNTIKETREQLENLGKIRQPNAIRNDIMKIQSRLNQNLKRRSKDNVLGDVKSTQERNVALTESHSKFYNAARDASLYRNRNFGQEGFKYFKDLKKWTDWSAQSETLKNLNKQAKDAEGQFNLATMSYEKLLEEQKSKGTGTDTILDEDVEHAQKQVESLRAQLAGIQKQKYAVQLEIDIRKDNKKLYDTFFEGSRDPKFMKQFGRAQTPSRDSFNVKLKQMEDAYASGIKKSTEQFMSPIDNEKLMEDIQADEAEIKRLQNELSKLNSSDFKKQVEDLQNTLIQAENNYKMISKEITIGEVNEQKLNEALQETQILITNIENKTNQLQEDMRQNPQQAVMMNESLAKVQEQLDSSKKRLNVFTRFSMRIFRRIGTNIVSQIASIMNPITNLRKAWSAWLDRFDNKAWANTFEVIKYNLVTAITPILEKIAKLMLKIAAIANVFTKKFAGVDLFDKSAWSAEKLKKGVDSVTSSLDELHTVSNNPDENNTVFDKGIIDTDDLLSNKTETALEKFADGVKNTWSKVTGFVKDHPLLTAGLVGAWLTKGLWGPAVAGLIKKGLGKIFGSGAAEEGAAAGGSLLGKIFGKELYTGMNGKAVTVGKLLGGIALTAGGTALAISQAADAGKNWQDLSKKAKAIKVGLVGLGSAAAGVGAVMLGASGPVGWAVAGTVALTSFVVGMAKTQDGIDSVKKETKKLGKVQEQQAQAQQNYDIATNNNLQAMINLRLAEEQAGITGKELQAQVDAGVKSVDNMTAAELQVYYAYAQAQKAAEELAEATKLKEEADHQTELQALRVEAANAIEANSYDNLREKVIKAWQDGAISAEEAGDILSRALANADDETQKVFGENLPKEINEAFNPDKYESGWRKFKTGLKDAMTKAAEGAKLIFDTFINGIRTGWNNMIDDLKEGASKLGQGVRNYGTNVKNAWNNSSGWDKLWNTGKALIGIGSYDVGTNYVPNDQLAMVHKGEAIIPAKYNKGYQPTDNGLTQVIGELQAEINALRAQMAQGINVSGEFRQRGNDLVAVVEKGKNKNGHQALNNPAYAR